MKLRRSAGPADEHAGSSRVGGRRSWPQRLVIAFNLALVMICLTSAYALAVYSKKVTDIPRVALQGSLTAQDDGGAPMNFLIVGADNAEGLDNSDPVTIGRNMQTMLTDTIMILRVDPNQEKAWLLSLPRDLYVPIADNKGKDRINTALALGGPELLIRTIDQAFGIPIHHFLQVNFFAFKQLVDMIDGVNVYFNTPARDFNTGMFVDDPGCRKLNGDEALAFARSRYYEARIDGQWKSDPTSDHGRIARQQYFIKQALKKAIERGARNPIQLGSMIDLASKYVVIDHTLTIQQVLDLGSRFQSFNPDDLEVFEPFTRNGYAGPAAVLFLEEQPSQPMFDIFRGVNRDADALAATRIEVRNGTGKVGEAQRVADDLKRRGFTVTGVTDSKDFRNDRTVIKHAPGDANVLEAIFLARYLEGNVLFEAEPALATTDHPLALVVGRDFAGVRTDPKTNDQMGPNGSGGSTPSTSTSSTPGPATTTVHQPVSPQEQSFIPRPPQGVEC